VDERDQEVSRGAKVQNPDEIDIDEDDEDQEEDESAADEGA